MSIAAVIFDMDGVLIDSEPVWEKVRHDYVVLKDGRWQPDAQRKMMGMSTDEWAAYMSDDLGVAKPLDAISGSIINLMAAQYLHHVPAIPGAVDAVKRLSTQFKLGLASSSPATLIDLVLDRLGLIDDFSAVTSTADVGSGKPSPDVYLETAKKLTLKPAQCAAVEDSTNGLISAHAAGMRVIAIPRPEFPPAPDALALADVVLDNIDQLTAEVITG
ncbi:HAD family hydrolase [Nocardia camponoti]|uniref:Haloacid dehalogenase n=1 Tax=Nocardia camponoti TaxID=1616106 RepID=A0A917Q920_9NOCA|nr:HAD-IA family hydrolase [Nocardia camponoti]GGK33456.1 haloacid dehalogenase [Nocardia camponoti]